MGKDKQAKSNRASRAPGVSPIFLLLIVITGALLTIALPQSGAQKPGTFSLTILHTNDLHSHDESFSERGKTIGGITRLAHLIRQFRAQNPHCLTIDAGDIFQGTPFFTIYKGEVEVEMLNRAGYDLYTIGNHEFDGGGINLAKQLSRAKFEVLSCNLDCKDLPELGKEIKPSTVRVIDGEKVGFVGAITPDIETLSLSRDGAKLKTGEYKSQCEPGHEIPWMAPIKAEVDKLTSQGVNKIVLITHCGTEVDKIIACELPAVDAIIGGHSHTRLDTPIVVEHKDGSHTLIVQTGCYSRNLGKFDLVFDKDGVVNLADTKYRLIKVDSRVPEEKDLKDYLATKEEPVKKLRDTVVATATADFDNNFRIMKCDSALGDLICDAFATSAEGKAEGTEITLENRGGIRSRIDRGPITLEKVEEILPFDNHMIYATMTGATLRQVLEHSIDTSTGGKFFDVSGLKFGWDPEKPKGERLVFMLARKDGKWQPMDDKQGFRVGMTDYSFLGGEGYDFAGATNVHKTHEKLNVYLRNYLEQQKTVSPQRPNRIAVLSQSAGRGVLTGDFGEALTGYSKPTVSILTGDSIGVSYETLDRPSTTVPLEKPILLRAGLTPKQASAYISSANARKDMKAWTVFVVRAFGEKDKHVTLVSYPLTIQDLKPQ